ncbi:hypothetical protein [Micromonospora sp. NPDC049679]|uniref:hypothetical protein n=1 Tax=Micromonospora sp. NPDC049679 TaxID=3155920 RepID=UPI0033D9E7F9
MPLPPGAPTDELVAGIERWVTADPFRDLVRAFGGRLPAGDPATLLGWLDEFSATHWDFRHGRERPEAREPSLDPTTARLVIDAARSLGMVTALPPPRRAYRHLLVLGGLAHACLQRTDYAAHLLDTGAVRATEVAVLGSFRPLTADERDVLAGLGLDACDTEVAALDAGVRRAFGVRRPEDETGRTDANPHCSWSVRTYRPEGGPVVRVLAAPSSDPGVRRAHTADTQHFWAQQVRLSPDDRVLMVTAPIYVPFQHCDAIRTLAVPYGCGIDTIGVDPDRTHPGLPEPVLTSGRYLQEIRSAIRSMRHLHAALPGARD